jgi:hypothetical protein
VICGREICPFFSAVTVKIGNFYFVSAPAALTWAAETINIIKWGGLICYADPPREGR